MYKVTVLGDIHGRKIWDDIIQIENPDLTIFLGDYVSTHEDISPQEQIENLENILEYKEKFPNEVVLLRGNHDLQHLGYYWAGCSGFVPEVNTFMCTNKERILEDTQWVYILNNIIFSHAGISKVWMKNSNIEDVKDINSLEPSEIFGFTPDNMFDNCGMSVTQPLTWIRPQYLSRCNINNYDQVVGHTPVSKITNIKQSSKGNRNILLCDCITRQYLNIEDNEFCIKSLK